MLHVRRRSAPSAISVIITLGAGLSNRFLDCGEKFSRGGKICLSGRVNVPMGSKQGGAGVQLEGSRGRRGEGCGYFSVRSYFAKSYADESCFFGGIAFWD